MSPDAVRGARGAVSAGSELAARAAIDVLAAGGNAVDAAIAGSAVQCVVEMPWCGLGGDAFAIVRTAAGEVLGLNGSGAAPRDVLNALGELRKVPRFGPISVATPGLVDVWAQLAARCGSMSVERLLDAARTYASNGFALDQRMLNALAAVPSIEGGDQLASLADGVELRTGATWRQPDLAGTLEAIAVGGRDEFYRGEIAKRIAGYVGDRGGALGLHDMAGHRSEWVAPLQATYRGARVLTNAPVSMGALLLVCLRVVERVYPDGLDAATLEVTDTLVRLKRLVFSRVLPLLGDPRAVGSIDVLSDDLIDELVTRLDEHELAPEPDDLPDGPDTTSITVSAADGSGVTFIHSLFNEFGSRELVPGTGIVLNDRLANLVPGTGAPNELAPGKRPMHTLHTYAVQTSDGWWLAGATPGGRGQVQTNVQVLLRVLDGHQPLADAVAAPRWVSGMPRRAPDDDTLYLETGLAPIAAELAALGHSVELVDAALDDHFGNCTIVRHNATGTAHEAAADSRRAGYAAAL